MRIFNYIVLSLLVYPFLMSAQDHSPQEQLMELLQENRGLNKKISEQESEINNLNDSINSYRLKMDRLNNEISDLNNKNTLAEQEKQGLRQQIENERQAAANSGLETEIADLKQQLLQKENEIEKVSRENLLLQQELSNLSQFKKEYLVMVAKNVDTEWLNKKLAEINLTDLDFAITNYSNYASEDQRIAQALDKLKILHQNATTYSKAVEAVNSQYNAQNVKNIQRELNKVSNKLTNPNHADEVEEVSIQLFDYPGSVQAFKELIQTVDKECAGEDSSAAAFAMVNDLLENDSNIQRKIKQINNNPWLKEQYLRYFNQLKKDAKAPNPTGVLIMSL